jgi:alkanesulfonate monooxygenase SsuD/methylene tetrahydromethanopterin reductase-like flavin-dependent oxidoreductase (luciferase family)
MAKCKFGLTLTNRGVLTGASSIEDMLWLAKRADQDEVWDSLWVGDSLLAIPRIDSIALLGGLALQTQRVRLGVACCSSTPLRPALQLAYQWASLDTLSDGRMIFCACQGGTESGGRFKEEYQAFGIDISSRMRRMEEAIEIMRLVTTEDEVSYHGEFNHFDQVTIRPNSVQNPLPIWVIANPAPNHKKYREQSLRRVARLGDGWMVTVQPPEIVTEYLAEIRTYAEQERRQLPADFEVAVYYHVNVNDDYEAAMTETKRYLDEYYTEDYSREFVDMWAAVGPVERCIAKIQKFIDAGATTITLRLSGYDQQKQYERVTNEVLPAFV